MALVATLLQEPKLEVAAAVRPVAGAQGGRALSRSDEGGVGGLPGPSPRLLGSKNVLILLPPASAGFSPPRLRLPLGLG